MKLEHVTIAGPSFFLTHVSIASLHFKKSTPISKPLKTKFQRFKFSLNWETHKSKHGVSERKLLTWFSSSVRLMNPMDEEGHGGEALNVILVSQFILLHGVHDGKNGPVILQLRLSFQFVLIY